MIHELLGTGSKNAKPGRVIAEQLHCDIRDVTKQIERERRQGKPICANSRGESAGYFLAETPEELQRYCKKLYKRGGELFKTRRALLGVLQKLQDKAGTGSAPERGKHGK